MTDSIKVSTVTAALAALQIDVTRPGGTVGPVKIRDTNVIPTGVNREDCPVLAPRPMNFVTNFGITRQTFGADSALKDVNYTLNYLFYYFPVAAGTLLFEKYDDMVTAAMVVLNYIATHTSPLLGTTDILPGDIPAFGEVVDAANKSFHGCTMTFRVIQYMET